MMDPILVRSLHDDSPCPLVGEVIGWTDEETAIVAWGDERFSDCPQGTEEAIDELTPFQEKGQWRNS